MPFWITAAVLTVAACLAVLLPLCAGAGRDVDPERGPAEADHDLEVYRDQLRELDREAERGLVNPAEAAEARAEIARRIIRADALSRSRGGARSGHAARIVLSAAVLSVPLVAWGVYAAIGSPDLPSQPLAARLAKDPETATIEELVARARAHLDANPGDARGWDVLAPVYVRLGRFAEAADAFANAIRLDGSTALREAGLGEALAGTAGGLVTAEARAAFERALKLDPAFPQARFYLATALAQEGRIEEALAGWQQMLETLPAQSPWRGAVEAAVAEGRQQLAAATAEEAEDVEAIAGMPEAERQAMIEDMVAGLDERLREDPADLEGWFRLVRSYVVLGRTEAARDALMRATEAFGEDSDEAERLVAFSEALGLAAVDRK